MKTTRKSLIQAIAATSLFMAVAIPQAPAQGGQLLSTAVANAARQACIESAQRRGFTVTDVVSVEASGTDSARVVLNLDRNGQAFRLTCGYTSGRGAAIDEGNNATAGAVGTLDTPSTTPLWWLLLPLLGLPLLLWLLRGRGEQSTAAKARSYVVTEGIVRRDGYPVEVRTGPGSQYNVYGALQHGQRVRLSGRYSNNWAELVEGGWVALDRLEYDPRYVNR